MWANAIDHDLVRGSGLVVPARDQRGEPNGCFYDRAYTYPHAMNTYFSMYKIASLYPGLVTYQQTRPTPTCCAPTAS